MKKTDVLELIDMIEMYSRFEKCGYERQPSYLLGDISSKCLSFIEFLEDANNEAVRLSNARMVKILDSQEFLLALSECIYLFQNILGRCREKFLEAGLKEIYRKVYTVFDKKIIENIKIFSEQIDVLIELLDVSKKFKFVVDNVVYKESVDNRFFKIVAEFDSKNLANYQYDIRLYDEFNIEHVKESLAQIVFKSLNPDVKEIRLKRAEQ
jgi:hypothetical protein